MNKVDKDISKTSKQLRSFIAKVEDSKYQTAGKFIRGEGFDFITHRNPRTESGSKLILGAVFEKYGPGVIYQYDFWNSGMLLMVVGVYANDELMDSKRFNKSQLGWDIKDYPKRKRVVYAQYFPTTDSIKYNITTLNDGWSSGSVYKIYGYYLQTIPKFMNWTSTPF